MIVVANAVRTPYPSRPTWIHGRHGDPPSGAQNPGDFAENALDVWKVVHRFPNKDQVESIVAKWQMSGVESHDR